MDEGFRVNYDLVNCPSAPSERSGHVCVSSSALQACFVFGGLGFGDAPHDDLWSLGAGSLSWRKHDDFGPRPTASFGAAGCLLRDERTMFVSGGLAAHENHLKSAHILNLESFHWQELDSTNLQPNWGSSAVSLMVKGKEMIFVFGGMHDDRCIPDILVWDTATWSLSMRIVPQSIGLPLRRRHAALSYQDQFMIIFGGRNQRNFFNDMWAYNALIDEWVPLNASSTSTDVARFFAHPHNRQHAVNLRRLDSLVVDRERMPDYFSSCLPRTGVAAVLVRNRYIVTFGGFLFAMQHAFSFDDLHAYDLRLHKWSRVVEVPRDRIPPRMTMCGFCLVPGEEQTLFLSGGRIEDTPTRTLFRLKLDFPAPLSLKQEAKLWCRCLSGDALTASAQTLYESLRDELVHPEKQVFAKLYFRLHDEEHNDQSPPLAEEEYAEGSEYDSDEDAW